MYRYVYIYMHIHIYTYVCACVCACLFQTIAPVDVISLPWGESPIPAPWKSVRQSYLGLAGRMLPS